MKSVTSKTRNQFLILISVSFCIIFSIVIFGKLFIHPFLDFINSDDKAYFKMAENIFEPVDAPWTYRILTPFLVYLLPFDTLIGFIIVNLSSLFATSILFFYYLKKLEFSFGICLVGVLFFLLNPITIFLIYAICFADLLLFFFFLLAFYALLCKNDLLFMISVTVGVTNKEIILITLILFFLYKFEEENKKFFSVIKSTILISLPPIAVFFLIRLLYNVDSGYFSIDTIFNVLSIHLSDFKTNIFWHPYRFYLVFGILWLISLLNFKKINNKFLKKSLYLIPFVFLQALIAIGYSRLFFIAFPIIIPISLYTFKEKNSIKMLLFLVILSIILVIVHFFSLLYYYDLSSYSDVMDPNSYFCWMLLNVLFGIFIIITLIFQSFKEGLNKNSSTN